MPMQHYGHEEQTEIQQRVHEVRRAFWTNVRLSSQETAD
jgi:hypothetical protein